MPQVVEEVTELARPARATQGSSGGNDGRGTPDEPRQLRVWKEIVGGVPFELNAMSRWWWFCQCLFVVVGCY